MKLAISTLGCPEWDFIEILEAFKGLGVEGIEVRGIAGEMALEKITWFAKENQEKTLDLLEAYGLKLIGFNTSISFHDETAFETHISTGKILIDRCSELGVPRIRVFGDRILDKENPEHTICRVIEGLKVLCAYAQDKNVIVNLEIHGDFNSIEAVQPVIEALKDYSTFGILWDIEHSYKVYRDDYLAFYQLILPYMNHVHIKDCIVLPDGTYQVCSLGAGTVPIEKIVKQLVADGYTGYLSLEWEKKWHPHLDEPEIAFPAFTAFMARIQEGLM